MVGNEQEQQLRSSAGQLDPVARGRWLRGLEQRGWSPESLAWAEAVLARADDQRRTAAAAAAPVDDPQTPADEHAGELAESAAASARAEDLASQAGAVAGTAGPPATDLPDPATPPGRPGRRRVAGRAGAAGAGLVRHTGRGGAAPGGAATSRKRAWASAGKQEGAEPVTATLPEQELQARVQALSAQVEELTQRLDQSTAPAAGGEAPTLLFSDVEGWVRGLFLPMFGWRIDAQRGDRPARHVEVEPAGADPAPPG